MKPASRTSTTLKTLGKTVRDTSEAPPKRRRQLTADVPKPGNPFGALQQLTAKALNGKGQF